MRVTVAAEGTCPGLPDPRGAFSFAPWRSDPSKRAPPPPPLKRGPRGLATQSRPETGLWGGGTGPAGRCRPCLEKCPCTSAALSGPSCPVPRGGSLGQKSRAGRGEERKAGHENSHSSGPKLAQRWEDCPAVPLELDIPESVPHEPAASQTTGSASPSPTTVATGGGCSLCSGRTRHPPWGLWLHTLQALTFDPIFLSMSSTRTFC